MFGDLLGNVEQQQKALNEKLKSILINESIDNGAISIEMNAAQEVLNFKINADIIDTSDSEKLEDLLTILVNNALAKCEELKEIESQKMIKELMPSGLDGLTNMFG